MKKAWFGFAVIASLFLLGACTPVQPNVPEPGKTEAVSAPEEKKAPEKDEPKWEATEAQYLAYTKAAFDAAVDKKRVLFFHAAWCPTCKAADAKFLSGTGRLPSDAVIFKVNYDTEMELKKKYGITYQHTYVYVDAQGNEIAKWNGGDTVGVMNHLK